MVRYHGARGALDTEEKEKEKKDGTYIDGMEFPRAPSP
jgi:hypothetical protein